LDSGGQIDFDYEKAFNEVPHRRLISKLGIHSRKILWIADLLEKRQFRFTVNSKYSSWHEEHIGLDVAFVVQP